MGGVRHQAQRQSDHRTGRGLVGEKKMAGMVMGMRDESLKLGKTSAFVERDVRSSPLNALLFSMLRKHTKHSQA